MFPDSEIALKILLGRSKLGYVVNYGLAPYFRGKLFKSLKPECAFVSPKFTSCFDESFNRISNRKQLDVHLIYFDDTESRVKRCCIGSQFMGTVTTAETSYSLKKVHCGLDNVHNMIQISMDGPNVNWKMLETANIL